MARSGFQGFTRHGIPIVVAFEYVDGFADVAICNAWTRDEEKDVTLTDSERDRYAAWIMEHRSTRDQYDNAADSALYDAT